MKKIYFYLLTLFGFFCTIAAYEAVELTPLEHEERQARILGYGTVYPGVSCMDDINTDDEITEDRELASVYKKITSKKGRRRPPKKGASSNHKGIDYAMACGTPVPARQSGIVSKAGWAKGYGKTVGIDFGARTAIYAHLSSISVRQGQRVKAGQIIGKSGKTGIATGCHLHYENDSRLYQKASLEVNPGNDSGTTTVTFHSQSER